MVMKGEDVKKEEIGQGDRPSYVNTAKPVLRAPAAAHSKGSGGKGVAGAGAGVGILEGYQEESGEDEQCCECGEGFIRNPRSFIVKGPLCRQVCVTISCVISALYICMTRMV
jgi:hypothetical protein